MCPLQSNQLRRSPVSDIVKTVGDTESTATIWPWEETASPATISIYLEQKRIYKWQNQIINSEMMDRI